MLTKIGLEYIAKNTCGLTSNAFPYFALGAGSTAESEDDTALASENTLYGAARKIASCSFSSPATAIWTATFAFSGDVTVREYGIFDDANHMLARVVLDENNYYHDGMGATFTVMVPLSAVIS